MAAEYFYEAQIRSYTCIPACVAMILRRYGHDAPTQQELIDLWCANGEEAHKDNVSALLGPLRFQDDTTIIPGTSSYLQIMGQLERGERWFITWVSCYGWECIARLATPRWTSTHQNIATLSTDHERDLRDTIKKCPNIQAKFHAVVLCGYDRDNDQVALLDPYYDSAPRPIWLDEEDFSNISALVYHIPTTKIP